MLQRPAGDVVFIIRLTFRTSQTLFVHKITTPLHSLQVHGLFTNEELDSTLAPLKEVVASQALLGQTLFSFFTAQVQRNLRIVISMDPSSPDFQHRCQANPALFSRSGLLSDRLANVKQNLPQRHTAATLCEVDQILL